MEFDQAEEWYLKELQFREDDEYEELCSLHLSLINCFRKTSRCDKIPEASRKAAACAERCPRRFVKKNALQTLMHTFEEAGNLI